MSKTKTAHVNDLLYVTALSVIWLAHVLFIGWWSQFTSKEKFVLKSIDDVTSLKRTSHNRLVNDALDDVMWFNTKRMGNDERPYPDEYDPITVVHRDSAWYLTDVWIISNRNVKMVLRGSYTTMTILSDERKSLVRGKHG